MKTWVDEQVTQGGYGTASEFFRQLIREEHRRKWRAEVDQKLLEALDRPTEEVTPEWWQQQRDRLAEFIAGQGRRNTGS